MRIQCSDCKKFLGEKPGGNPTDITHTYCKTCFAKVKMELLVMRLNGNYGKSGGKTYHPWTSKTGKFMIFESQPYRGGMIFSKYCEFYDSDEMDLVCLDSNELKAY